MASMCIQEEGAARPPIRNVVAALSNLANHAYELISSATGQDSRECEIEVMKLQRQSRFFKTDAGGVSGPKWDLEGFGKNCLKILQDRNLFEGNDKRSQIIWRLDSKPRVVKSFPGQLSKDVSNTQVRPSQT